VVRIVSVARQVLSASAVPRGQTLIEYTLILAVVAIATLLLMVAVGWDLQETFDQIENLLGAGSNGMAPGDDDGAPS
jgi:Flp pilus assembly pilin Flp